MKLVDRMKQYKEFYENFVPGDSGFHSMPQLILVCEDDKHMAETFKVIAMKALQIEQIKLYFTTDLKQNGDTLTDTLVEFVLDKEKNKYKAKTVELKLLGIE